MVNSAHSAVLGAGHLVKGSDMNMTRTFKGFLLTGGSIMTLLSMLPAANATTYTLDFTSLPLYTPVASGPGPLDSISMYGSGISGTR
jgi:hypothetical protein